MLEDRYIHVHVHCTSICTVPFVSEPQYFCCDFDWGSGLLPLAPHPLHYVMYESVCVYNILKGARGGWTRS